MCQVDAIRFCRKLLTSHSNCLFSGQMFKGKENHLNLIQEVRTENALQQAEQQLLGDDIQLVETLTEQRDAARHEVERTLAFAQRPRNKTSRRLISASLPPARRPRYRRSLGRRR